MSEKIVNLDAYRDKPGEFVFSVSIHTDGLIQTNMNTAHLQTIEEINWAIALVCSGLAELTDLKRDLMK